MPLLHQGAGYPILATYGYQFVANVDVTGAPPDADFGRWAMLHDGVDHLLYCFQTGSDDTLYAFGWNGTGFEHGYNASPSYTLIDAPPDVDFRSITMLHSGANYHAYFHQAGNPTTNYQFVLVPGTTTFKWNYSNFGQKYTVFGFPADADWSRWDMTHDNVDYRIYAFKQGSNDQLYQGAFNVATLRYEYAHRSNPVVELVGFPNTTSYRTAAISHDGRAFRVFFTGTDDADPGGRELCTSFATEADNTRFGASFSRDAFTFEALDPGDNLMANSSGSSIGLQFSNDGLLITLPEIARAVRLHVGKFNTDVTVEALAPDGTVQHAKTVVAVNAVEEMTLIGEIAKVKLTGGGYEGMIVDICAVPA
jgi:hypothetical protein